MATYNYKCTECENITEKIHSMREEPVFYCEECEGLLKKTIPQTCNFMLKGLSWSGKNTKEKSYRMQRRKEMGQKMAKNHDIPSISPNYRGTVCKDWDEAKKMAKEDGINMSRYEKQVENLKGQEKRIEEKRKKLLKGEDT